MLSLFDLKRILNPNRDSEAQDTFRVLDSWAEYSDDTRDTPEEKNLNYLCYQLETMNPNTGEITRFYKAIKFARVIRLPGWAKQSTSLMDMHQEVLAGVFENNYNFITVIANVINPEPLGLLFLYGVQGISEDLAEAKQIADLDFNGFVYMMQGTYRVLEMQCVKAKETEWLREKMYNMPHLTMVRGIPFASKTGEDVGNKGMGNKNVNPDSEGTLEEIITGMSDYEYVIEILSTPVYMDTLQGWQQQTQRSMTAWNNHLQGNTSLSFNLSIPMMYMANASQSQGWNRAYSDSSTVSTSAGESFTMTDGVSVGESLSQTYSRSVGHSNSMSLSQSHSLGTSQTTGVSLGETYGQSVGHGVSSNFSQNIGQSRNSGISENYGQNTGQNYSKGLNEGTSASLNQGGSMSTGHTVGNGTSYGVNSGSSATSSHSVGQSVNDGWSQNKSANQSNTASVSNSTSSSQSINLSESWNDSETHGYNEGRTDGLTRNDGGNYSNNHSLTQTQNGSTSGSITGKLPGDLGSGSVSKSGGWAASETDGSSLGGSGGDTYSKGDNSSKSESYSHSEGGSRSANTSISDSQSTSMGASYGISDSAGYNHSAGANESYSATNGQSFGENWGANASVSDSVTGSQSYGMTTGASAGKSASVGASIGKSYGLGQNYSVGSSAGQSVSQGVSSNVTNSFSKNVSQSQSVSNSETLGETYGQSVSESTTESAGGSVGQNYGRSQSASNGSSYTVSNGSNHGISNGTSGTMSLGTSSSLGLGPSIGYNKGHQWLDQGVKDLLELMEFQNQRIKKALRGEGAFYTYVYIACPSLDALAAAQALAKSTWQNENAMVQPLQVLDLSDAEQQQLLYRFAAFSSDVTREDVYGVDEYKYCTVLLPEEFVAYTHLPRISEGGVFSTIQDVPKFSVPSMLKGDIYMGTILNAERYTFKNGYNTQFDYRIDEDNLMHGFFTGASRSGKTVAATRFVAELSRVRRSKTGKRMRIVVLDPKQDWRVLARYVEPERFNFYSLGNPNFHAIKINPWKVPKGVWPQIWIDGIIDIYCRSYGLLERGKQMVADVVYELYTEAGVFEACDNDDWKERVPQLSAKVNFVNIYKRFERKKIEAEDPKNLKAKMGNDTRDAFARLLERLSCFGREVSIERKLYGTSEGMGIDELIGDDDITVLESKGLENTFKNFIFGAVTSGFYQYAIAHDGGYLAPDQYETVLVIEEANEILIGTDTAKQGGSDVSLPGESQFEQMLDQAAGYGLFIFAITQKIADMPTSVIANSGIVFIGRLKRADDITVATKTIGKDERYDDRDVAKWFPRCPTGWFVCQTSRTFDFKDADPILVKIAQLNLARPENDELDEILGRKRLNRVLQSLGA